MAANDRKATGKTVPTYLELREELLRRDRSLRHKVVSLEEATSFVRDGDSVGIGGSTMSRTPMGMRDIVLPPLPSESRSGEHTSEIQLSQLLTIRLCPF